MSIDLDVTCDCCNGTVEVDGEVYCASCWIGTISTLPTVEKALRKLAAQLTGDAAKKCEQLADQIYDLNLSGKGDLVEAN